MDEQLTLEYIFFHPEPYRRFKQFLQDKQVPLLAEGTDHTNVEGLVLRIADNLDDALQEAIENYYDAMLALNETMVTGSLDEDAIHQVGLAVSLQDGRSVLASVQPDVLNRVLTVLSQQELGSLVDAIVAAVENPDERPLCKF